MGRKTCQKTSQPPVGLFAETFAELAKDGSQIIAILLSHALSGTVEAARQGATLSGADVTILDSSFTDQAEKFQVVEAARMAQAGASKERKSLQLLKQSKKNGIIHRCINPRKSSQGWSYWTCSRDAE